MRAGLIRSTASSTRRVVSVSSTSEQRPAVRLGASQQLLSRLGQRDIQTPFPGANSSEQILKRKRRLARTRVAVDEIEPLADQATVKHLIQAEDTCGRSLDVYSRHFPPTVLDCHATLTQRSFSELLRATHDLEVQLDGWPGSSNILVMAADVKEFPSAQVGSVWTRQHGRALRPDIYGIG
jgi:hypothetical protein